MVKVHFNGMNSTTMMERNPQILRQITLHYDRVQIELGDGADIDGWLENLSARIAAEFEATVLLSSIDAWGGHGVCSHDSDVEARLREIAATDEWIELVP